MSGLWKLVHFDKYDPESCIVYAIVNPNDQKSIKAYTQYIMNVANNPEQFYWMREDRKAAKVTLVAERLGIHKQTFEERMSGK